MRQPFESLVISFSDFRRALVVVNASNYKQFIMHDPAFMFKTVLS